MGSQSVKRFFCLAMLLASSAIGIAQDAIPAPDRPWNRDVIYFAMTDRFCDGDPDNNVPVGSDPDLFDATQSDISRYHGGDLRGIELAIRDGYFRDLGVTALWLTPPVKNAWRSPYDLGGPKTGYHGYWTQDFLDIDPHLTSRTSIDGTAYTDDRDGRMQHYRDVVSQAHANGLKVIQDIVCNHVGPLFYYDHNANGSLDFNDRSEWIAPFRDQPYSNTNWNDQPMWNLSPPMPDGPQVVLGSKVATTNLFRDFRVYGRRGFNDDSLGKSDGEEVTCDFFSLRDFATSPQSDHFDALVEQFVAIYHFYIDVVGVDGMRIDTVKHVHHPFWTEFTRRLRQRLGEDASKLLLFGEVYDGNPRVLGRYTFAANADGTLGSDTCLDSLLNFEFCFNLRDYLRKPGDDFGNAWGLRRTTDSINAVGSDAFFNDAVGADGLRPRDKMINFFENHDGLNRFLVRDVDDAKQTLASVILMTSQGIPCMYYGSESGLRDDDGNVNRDSETGRMTYCRGGDPSTLDAARHTTAFRVIQSLTELRTQTPSLTDGRMVTLYADRDDTSGDEGIYVYARYLTGDDGEVSESVIVAVNANPNAAARVDRVPLSIGENAPSLANFGDRFVACDLVDAIDGGVSPELTVRGDVDGGSLVAIEVPPSSALVWRLERRDE